MAGNGRIKLDGDVYLAKLFVITERDTNGKPLTCTLVDDLPPGTPETDYFYAYVPEAIL